MKCNIIHALKCLVLIGSLLLLSACISNTTKTSTVEERATVRWEKLLSGDLAGAYEYLSPGYRSSVSSLDYQRAMLLNRVQWTDAQYKSSECTELTCDVKIQLGFKVSNVLPGVKSYEGEKDIVESWILVDGIWYLVP